MPPVHEVNAPNRRLDSWKEIAGFFDRDERTVKRWEKERQLPVHRLPGGARARVFAFTEELDRWMHSIESPAADSVSSPDSLDDTADPLMREELSSPSTEEARIEAPPPARNWKPALAVIGCALLALLVVGISVVSYRRHAAALTRSAAANSARRALTGTMKAGSCQFSGRSSNHPCVPRH